MFSNFNCSKTDYQSGQIAPFLIAVICVLIILAMITANLGQIAMYKTDTSNAADAAALSGTSTLAGTLLGLGLRSDTMAGRGVEAFIAILLYIVLGIITWGATWTLAIVLYINFLIGQWSNLMISYGDARMAWTRAKRTAVQYAFNNASVDEPRPTFEEFLKGAYGLSEQAIKSLPTSTISVYYQEYIIGDSANARWYGQSGFSLFMMDQENGYWDESEMGVESPGEFSKAKVVSGYGWNDGVDETIWRRRNSFRDGGSYSDYDNWVEVTVLGDIMYGIEYSSMLSSMLGLPVCIEQWFLEKLEEALEAAGWFGEVLAVVIGALYQLWTWLVYTLAFWLLEQVDEQYPGIFPTGLRFFCEACGIERTVVGLCCEDEDIQRQVDDNPLIVKVKRYRKDTDLGLWTMHYGEVESEATSHVFRESFNKCEDIRPGVFPASCCYEDNMNNPAHPCDLDPPDEPGDKACRFMWDFLDSVEEEHDLGYAFVTAINPVALLAELSSSGNWYNPMTHIFESELTDVGVVMPEEE